MRKIFFVFLVLALTLQSNPLLSADFPQEKRQRERESLGGRFSWWPTDARPAPVKDDKRAGYWWWPKEPGKAAPWGNRGYVYVNKIIFDYKEEELPAPQPEELRLSLIVKKIIKNVKIYFDYDRAELRADHIPILEGAVKSLKKNPQADILITGNCDRRGSENYNRKLGVRRGEAVRNFMIEKGIPEERIRIVSKGKLDAVAPVTDLVGMQKDRNAQFMVAEVEETMIPYRVKAQAPEISPFGREKHITEESAEEIESQIKVSTREYLVKEQDTIRSIAQEQLGAAHRWRYLYEFNQERIKDPDALEPGTVIIVPVEQEAVKKAPGKAALSVSGPVSTRTYTIGKNDSLWKIARKQLGDGKRWKEIFELNKDRISNPDAIIPGVKITIPAE